MNTYLDVVTRVAMRRFRSCAVYASLYTSIFWLIIIGILLAVKW